MAKLMTAAKSYGLCIGRSMALGDLTGTVSIFTITGGPIAVYNLGFMVTTLMATTNTLKFQLLPTSGTLTDLCGATDTDAAAVAQLFVVNGTKATALVKTTDVGILAAGQTLTSTMPIVLSTGVIKAIFSSTSTAGAGLVFMQYAPLSHYTQVTVETS